MWNLRKYLHVPWCGSVQTQLKLNTLFMLPTKHYKSILNIYNNLRMHIGNRGVHLCVTCFYFQDWFQGFPQDSLGALPGEVPGSKDRRKRTDHPNQMEPQVSWTDLKPCYCTFVLLFFTVISSIYIFPVIMMHCSFPPFLCLRHRRWCRRHHVFGLSVRPSVRPYVRPVWPLSQYLKNHLRFKLKTRE